jgi:hypothetical protein
MDVGEYALACGFTCAKSEFVNSNVNTAIDRIDFFLFSALGHPN